MLSTLFYCHRQRHLFRAVRQLVWFGTAINDPKPFSKFLPWRLQRAPVQSDRVHANPPTGWRINKRQTEIGIKRSFDGQRRREVDPCIERFARFDFQGTAAQIELVIVRNVAHAVFGSAPSALDSWTDQRCQELDRGEVESVIEAIRCLSPRRKEQKEICEKEIAYFERNKDRMHYDEFRKRGLFIGSGVVEAGCRTVVGQRLKQSGMFWTVNGANSVIALRCSLLSNRWEDFWEYRACA